MTVLPNVFLLPLLACLGIVNRINPFIGMIFVAYPAQPAYQKAYCFGWHARLIKVRPWLVGWYRQNDLAGLMFVVSLTDRDLLDPNTKTLLRRLVRRVEMIRRLVGAKQSSYAGIIPGVLARHGLRRECPETETTVAAVGRALDELCALIEYETDTPVIVLGGRGHVGRLLVKLLQLWGREVYSVDLLEGRRVNHEEWPMSLVRRKVILVSLVPMPVVENYLFSFWPEIVILNEAYPPPGEQEIANLQGVGVRVFHVVGVEALSLPQFPLDYQGGIPCCAAWNSPGMRVILRELTLNGHQKVSKV
ncbi:hypothetical protein HYV71_03985 [Candidatus Uhrbacteria bacterium]|nr:hypothetical protein [Candidatus Uhrbacteria bacterium]